MRNLIHTIIHWFRPKPERKSNPYPVRFTEEQEHLLRQIGAEIHLPLAEVIRMCCRYAAPKFLSGEVDIFTLKPRQ